ncbi:hypothetical protein FXO37_17206 [Capsicum annuum]|nr:hypothetical protein FXO37_17206 [Capsicum annuum]
MEIYPYPNKIVPFDPLVYVHGAFHWLGHLNVERKIHLVSFDISNEVFGVLPLLEEMFIGIQGLPDIGISLLDGMLCFHITADGDNLSYTFKLWAMKDYGVKESWMVLFTIQAYDLVTVKPRYRFPDGDVLLYSLGELPHQGLKPWTLTFQTPKENLDVGLDVSPLRKESFIQKAWFLRN